MAPSAEDDDAALGGTLTADHRVGTPFTLGEGAVADGCMCPCC